MTRKNKAGKSGQSKKPSYVKPATVKKTSLRNKTKSKVETNKKETYPHFRRFRKSAHPALIVDEHSSEEYKYRKVMHGEKDGRHTNEEVNPNPDLTDPRPMFIARRVRHDKKTNFEKRLPWKYPKK